MLDFLKTTQEAIITSEPPVTTETPKPSISQRIRDYKEANPNATIKHVAEAVGTSLPYVYQVLGSPKKEKKKVAKKTEIVLPKHKTEGFAIGVSQSHYWVISALASGKKTSRTAILQGIIDKYIREVLTEVSQDGASV